MPSIKYSIKYSINLVLLIIVAGTVARVWSLARSLARSLQAKDDEDRRSPPFFTQPPTSMHISIIMYATYLQYHSGVVALSN
jgi:hypothetical protein